MDWAAVREPEFDTNLVQMIILSSRDRIVLKCYSSFPDVMALICKELMSEFDQWKFENLLETPLVEHPVIMEL